MTRILIDTKIVIDLLSKREPYYDEAAKLFSLADKGNVNLVISSLTFVNTNYILSRLKSARQAKVILRKFKILVEIANLDEKIIELALSDDRFGDFEDGLQYYTAIENESEIILSRNKKDFKNSEIPILSAKEYLASE